MVKAWETERSPFHGIIKDGDSSNGDSSDSDPSDGFDDWGFPAPEGENEADDAEISEVEGQIVEGLDAQFSW